MLGIQILRILHFAVHTVEPVHFTECRRESHSFHAPTVSSFVGVVHNIEVSKLASSDYNGAMLTPSDTRRGLVLRVVRSLGIAAPVGCLATVERVGMHETRSGQWWYFTVRYHQQRRSPKQRQRMYRRNLWERDLKCFELVSREEKAAKSKRRDTLSSKTAATLMANRRQMKLPLPEQGDVDS